MADATVVRTTEDAVNAALIPLISQYDSSRANSSGILAPFIEGAPGIGKTEVTLDLAKKLGIKKVVVVSCGVIDTNLEFIGLPEIVKVAMKDAAKDGASGAELAAVREIDVESGEESIKDVGPAEKVITQWIKPERLASFDDLGPDERGLLLFDDTHFLLERQQAMMMQLLTNNRTIHTHKVGNGANVGIMFLANRMDDNAGAQEMLAPVIDRVKRIVIDLDPKLQSVVWKAWAEDEGLNPAVIDFIDKSPELLYTFKPEADRGIDETQQKFASPRGWANFARELGRLEIFSKGSGEMDAVLHDALPGAQDELKKSLREASSAFLKKFLTNYASGTVGEVAAKEFSAYYRVFNRYDINNFIGRGQKALKEIPQEELATASYRFGVEIARECSRLDADIIRAMAEYCVENHARVGRTPKAGAQLDVLKKLEADPSAYDSLTPEETKSILLLSYVVLKLGKNSVELPSQVVAEKYQELVESGKPFTFKDALEGAFENGLQTLKRPRDAQRYKELFTLFGDYLAHLQKSSPELKTKLCADFVGAFAAESKRLTKKRGKISFSEDMNTSEIIQDIVLTELQNTSPETIEYLMSRSNLSDLVQRVAPTKNNSKAR